MHYHLKNHHTSRCLLAEVNIALHVFSEPDVMVCDSVTCQDVNVTRALIQ